MMSTQRRAVIVGAGIGGLASAIALERAGWRVALLERNSRLRGDPASLSLQPNAVRALRSLGLGLALDAIGTPLDAGRLRRFDGKQLATIPVSEVANRFGARPVAVHREDLFEALVAALGSNVEVHTGITATHVDLVHAAAGDQSRRWPADLVVGADGIGSAVRPGMDRASKVTGAGTVVFRATIPSHRVPDLPDGGGETQGPQRQRFVYAPVQRGACWTATVRGGPRPESVSVRHELLTKWFGDWHDPIPQLIAATRPEEIHQQGVSFLSPLPQSYISIGADSGAVLIGDAAHAMPPGLLQGAGLALEDAVTLGSCLAKQSIELGLASYDQQRHSRTVKLAKLAQRIESMFVARGKVGTSMRDGLLRAAPDSWFGKQAMAGSDWRPSETD